MMLGRWGVAAVLGYIGLCLVSQTVAQHLFARALGQQLATVERLTMRPLPGWGPVQWRGIAVTRVASLVSRVTLVPPSVTPPASAHLLPPWRRPCQGGRGGAPATCRRPRQHSANSATRSSGYGWSASVTSRRLLKCG
jgi:hypothetical protein